MAHSCKTCNKSEKEGAEFKTYGRDYKLECRTCNIDRANLNNSRNTRPHDSYLWDRDNDTHLGFGIFSAKRESQKKEIKQFLHKKNRHSLSNLLSYRFYFWFLSLLLQHEDDLLELEHGLNYSDFIDSEIKKKQQHEIKKLKDKKYKERKKLDPVWRDKERARCREKSKKTYKKRTGKGTFPRAQIWNQNFGLCGICGEEINPKHIWHVDHIIPVAINGNDELENLQPAHIFCNLHKGSSTKRIDLDWLRAERARWELQPHGAAMIKGRRVLAEHGTQTRYDQGCKCRPCKDAHNEYIRARRKAQQALKCLV